MKYKGLPLVPETVLRKRHDLDELRQKRASALETCVKKNRGFYVKKLETFVAQGRSRRNGEIRYNRVAKNGMGKRASNRPTTTTKDIEIEGVDDTKTITYQNNSSGSSVVFAIRVRDHHGACPMVKRALNRLRLRNINEGVFVRYDSCTQKLLYLVEPFIVYGPPLKSVVEDLLVRRGFGKVNGKRVALSDNMIIEQALGDECGVICVEDLVHVLFEVGDGFSKVNKFLWPFRLAHKTTHFERETLRLTHGKDYGDKGEDINDFIRHVL